MSQVSLIIYGVAALWAVQSLLDLMIQHRQRTLQNLQRAELKRREATAQHADEPSATVTLSTPQRQQTAKAA